MSQDGSSSDEEIFDEMEQEMTDAYAIMVPVYTAALSVVAGLLKTLVAGRSIPRMYTTGRRSIRCAGSQYIRRALADDPDLFRKEYRMYPFVFEMLCKIIREKGILQDTKHVGVEEMLATFLLVVGQGHRYCTTRRTFSRSHFTISQNFNRGLRALNVLAVDFMAKPATGVQAKIRDNTKFYPYFKDCIGAVDGSHITANVYGEDTAKYRNRHGGLSHNVLVACNFDLEFTFVLDGWKGSAHDSRVLNAVMEKENPFTVPRDKYYLVDCGFPNRRQFLAPHRGVRYHLQDFGGVGRHPENVNELFNLRHASLRNTVERIFGIFKSRFTIFKYGPPFPYKTQVAMVLACVGLHNFLRKECRTDEFPPEDEPLPFVEEEVDNDGFNGTERQQILSAAIWRDQIGQQMWEAATTDAHVDGN